MTAGKGLLLVCVLGLLAACSEKKAAPADAASTAAGPHSRSISGAVAAPKIPEAQRTGTRAFQCEIGGALMLDDYDDGTTHVTVNGVAHVLRPVNVDGGALLQGDNISIRLLGEQTTASQNGIVLNSGCKHSGES